MLATVGAGFAFTGPGAASLDRALDWELAGVGWGVFAVALGLVTAAAVLAARKPQPEAAAPTASEPAQPELERLAS